MRAAALLLSLAAVSAGAEAPAPKAAAVRRGVDFLLGSQNPDGSWGSAVRDVTPMQAGWPPESLRAWRTACTGLACMALMRHGETGKPLERGVDSLLENADLRRPLDWDTDHVWGWIYALEALAKAEAHPALASRRDRIRPAVDRLIGSLSGFQSPRGGWGYYDFDLTMRPPAWSTSFTTANGVLALRAAREAGHAVPAGMLAAAVQGLRKSRFPNGSYSYTTHNVRAETRWGADGHLKFSLSRIQVCNLALHLEGGGIAEAEIVEGLEHFFRHHKFLDVAYGRPIPHEAYYANSGYFYLYGHAYAADLIRLLPRDLRAKYLPLLEREVLKAQEKDGAWWDYPMLGFSRAYGTAFALLALAD